MPKRIKLFLPGLLAAAILAHAAGSASANRSIEVRGGPNVEASSRLTFGGTERSAANIIACDVTLRRTLTARVPKAGGTLFGKVTGFAIDRGGAGTGRSPNCTHGSFIREVHDIQPLIEPGVPGRHTEDGRGRLIWDVSGARAELWTLVYDSFQGTLPRIEGVNIHVKGFQTGSVFLEPFGGTVECLYEGNVFGLIRITRETGTSNSASVATERTALARTRGGAACPARVTFEGTFSIRPTITIALL
jgi:hypothetical protein